jgi:hypothetical protein
MTEWRELIAWILYEEFSRDFSLRNSVQMMIDFTNMLEKNSPTVKSNPPVVKEITALFER